MEVVNLHSDDFDGEIVSDPKQAVLMGEVAEDLEDISERNRAILEKVEESKKRRKKAEKKRVEEEDEIMLERKKIAFRMKVLSILYFPFNPDNWIKLIQHYEDLFYTAFLDVQIILPLFSLLYLSYIIISYDGNLESAILKGSGCICVCILCIIMQQFNSKQGK